MSAKTGTEPASPAIYDEYTGIGGAYVIDPETGARRPAAEIDTTSDGPPAQETEQ